MGLVTCYVHNLLFAQISTVWLGTRIEPNFLHQLGIFSGGLSSFLSSGDTENEVEEETATAGMELTVLGTQVRPFTFFNGQGELMGHVWSGTASERTTAYQVSVGRL